MESEGELNSDQKQRLRRDLMMMGYDEDEDFEEMQGANAHLIAGGFDLTEEGLRKGKNLTQE